MAGRVRGERTHLRGWRLFIVTMTGVLVAGSCTSATTTSEPQPTTTTTVAPASTTSTAPPSVPKLRYATTQQRLVYSVTMHATIEAVGTPGSTTTLKGEGEYRLFLLPGGDAEAVEVVSQTTLTAGRVQATADEGSIERVLTDLELSQVSRAFGGATLAGYSDLGERRPETSSPFEPGPWTFLNSLGPVLPAEPATIGLVWTTAGTEDLRGLLSPVATVIGDDTWDGTPVIIIESAAAGDPGTVALPVVVEGLLAALPTAADSAAALHQLLDLRDGSADAIELVFETAEIHDRYRFDRQAGVVVQAESSVELAFTASLPDPDIPEGQTVEFIVATTTTYELSDAGSGSEAERIEALASLRPDPTVVARGPLDQLGVSVLEPTDERARAVGAMFDGLPLGFVGGAAFGRIDSGDDSDVIALSIATTGPARGRPELGASVAHLLGSFHDVEVSDSTLGGRTISTLHLGGATWRVVQTNSHLFVVVGDGPESEELATALLESSGGQYLWQAGDCFDFGFSGNPNAPFGRLGLTHCDVLHTREVIHSEILDGGEDDPYPGEDLTTRRDLVCGQAFLDYVGVLERDTSIGMTRYWPSGAEWAEGDRYLACVVAIPSGGPLTGSLEGAGPEYETILSVGDCLESGGALVASCDEPHASEVIGVAVHPGAPGAAYPDRSELASFVEEACGGLLVEYASGGTEALRAWGRIDVFEWSRGIRDFPCVATAVQERPGEDRQVVGSFAGSWEPVTIGFLQVVGDATLGSAHAGSLMLTEGATLDCAGHHILGSGGGVGIVMADGAEVRNCLVSGFNTGVALGGTSGAVVEDTSVTDSRVGFYLVEGTSGATITGSTAERNEIGFLFEAAVSGVLLEGNVAVGNWRSGFMIDSTSDSAFVRNTVTGGGSGFWITKSKGNEFTGNVVSGASEWFSVGVFNWSSDNTFEGNEVSGGGVGIAVNSQAYDNVFIDNHLHGNSKGAHVEKSAGSGNTFTGNRVEDQSHVGLWDDTPDPADRYSSNMCSDNGDADSVPDGLCAS